MPVCFFFRIEVEGESMRPALEAGDRLLCMRGRRVRPGDVVAVPDPRQPARLLVKRVSSVCGGKVTVVGDNPARSTDSATFGPVPQAAVVGRAIYRYWPEERRGRLR